MLSRVADSIYWMARSMERAENLARLLQANSQLYMDAGAGGGKEKAFWLPILMTTGEEQAYASLFKKVEAESLAEFLTVSEDNPHCIRNCIRGARENARMIRDQISDEIWQTLNDVHLFLHSPRAERLRLHDPTEYYDAVMRASYLFQGVARATLGRGEAWLFLQMGTYLERADQTSRQVDTCSAVPLEMPPLPLAQPLRWASLLHSCSAYHAFHVASNHLEPRRILEFLFLAGDFPRSVRFCVREVERALRGLQPGNGKFLPPQRLAGRLLADLDFGTIDEILEGGVHEFIDSLQARLIALGESIFEAFVLYADLLPVDSPPALPVNSLSPGAWHPGDPRDQQQQQQQQ
jgi:uncharacterized alpha-E superfamily protein